MRAGRTRRWAVVAAGAAALTFVLGGCASTNEHLSAFAWGKPPDAASTNSTVTPVPTVTLKDVSGGTVPGGVDPGNVYSSNGTNPSSGQAVPLTVDLQCPTGATSMFGATVTFGYQIQYDQRELFSNSTFDYGDGARQSATTPEPIKQHKYAHGTYKVTLTVTVGSQTASGSCTLNV